MDDHSVQLGRATVSQVVGQERHVIRFVTQQIVNMVTERTNNSGYLRVSI